MGSKCIVRDTKVCEGISMNHGSLVTLAAMCKLLSFARLISQYCIGLCYC